MKNKYWLKGGLWGIGVYLVLSIILLNVDDFGLVFSILSPGTWIIVGIGGISAGIKFFIQFTVSIFVWLIIGTVIGWIIGKIIKKQSPAQVV